MSITASISVISDICIACRKGFLGCWRVGAAGHWLFPEGVKTPTLAGGRGRFLWGRSTALFLLSGGGLPANATVGGLTGELPEVGGFGFGCPIMGEIHTVRAAKIGNSSFIVVFFSETHVCYHEGYCFVSWDMFTHSYNGRSFVEMLFSHAQSIGRENSQYLT